VVWANTQFATVSFFPCLFSIFLIPSARAQVAPGYRLHQNWHLSAVSAKEVLFGGLDDDQSRLGVLTPKTKILGALIGISSKIYKKIQIVISSKLCIRLA